MILAELRDYLSECRRAPLRDLAARFHVEEEALRAMLEVWVRKGRLRRIDAGGSACGSCCDCDESPPEIYEWLGRDRGIG